MTSNRTVSVSLVIPVYNVEQFLPRLLDSILAQTREDWECILVDDGSTDASGKICNEYGKKDPRFRVIRQENSGAGPARNRGIPVANGKYLFFADSDDWLDPDALRLSVEEAERTSADILVFGFARHGRDKRRSATDTVSVPIGKIDLCAVQNPKAFRIIWNKLFRTAFIRENGLRFPPLYSGQDVCFCFSAYLYTERIYGLDKPLYHYCWNPLSISAEKQKKKPEELRALETEKIRLMEDAQKNSPPEAVARLSRLLLMEKISAKERCLFGNLAHPDSCALYRNSWPEIRTWQVLTHTADKRKPVVILAALHLDFLVQALAFTCRLFSKGKKNR